MGDVVMFTGTLVRVPPQQSAPCRIVPIPIRERTDLGGYRASLRYDDMLELIKHALHQATLSPDPETRRIGRQSLGDYARWAA